MGPEGNILVNSPISTSFQQSATHSALPETSLLPPSLELVSSSARVISINQVSRAWSDGETFGPTDRNSTFTFSSDASPISDKTSLLKLTLYSAFDDLGALNLNLRSTFHLLIFLSVVVFCCCRMSNSVSFFEKASSSMSTVPF